MPRCDLVLPVVLLFALAIPAGGQQKPAGKTPLPAINIELGDDEDSLPTPSSGNSSSPTGSAPGQTNAASRLDEDGSTQTAVKQAISKMLEQRTEKLKPSLISWGKASEELQKYSGGLVPDFTSPGDLQGRIKLYQNLKVESEKLADAIAATFKTMPEDLRKIGVPDESITEVNNAILADPERMMQRMRISGEMCGTAVQALTILKTEWGNWNYSKENGIQFLSKFNPASKLQYDNAIAKYQQASVELQNYGKAN